MIQPEKRRSTPISKKRADGGTVGKVVRFVLWAIIIVFVLYSLLALVGILRMQKETAENRSNISDAMEDGGETDNRFCLYETQNMWTFIMLDTFTGKNWQVQFSTKGTDYMFAAPINYWSKAYPSSTDRWQGRFKMFATQNMWTFIMLDSFTGRLWQVQYDTKSLDNLLCVSINEEVLEATVIFRLALLPILLLLQL